MDININKDELINIEKMIGKYDKVIFVYEEGTAFMNKLYGRIVASDAFRLSSSRLLILPAENYSDLVSLYLIYEFSDKIKILGKAGQYGNLFNYVENGILTEDEVFELILK